MHTNTVRVAFQTYDDASRRPANQVCKVTFDPSGWFCVNLAYAMPVPVFIRTNPKGQAAYKMVSIYTVASRGN